jgi:hypothetical protein
MPVRKFRTIEEMNAAEESLDAGDPRIVPRLLQVTRLALALAGPLGAPPGVHKYHSIEEMNADREKWEDARIARIIRERIRT